MPIAIQRSHERWHANHGRLDANHSFSFGGYYDPKKMWFGSLIVINQDTIAWGRWFSSHPHDNMEIITIPLSWRLAHKDSTGKEETIWYGDVQVMSAWTGVVHSEYNASKTDPVHLLQIRIEPHTQGVAPRHDSKSFDFESKNNERQLLVSDDGRNESLMIHQRAFISLAKIEIDWKLNYKKYLPANGIYLFVISGKVSALNESLWKSDSMEIVWEDDVMVSSEEESIVLVLEVPIE